MNFDQSFSITAESNHWLTYISNKEHDKTIRKTDYYRKLLDWKRTDTRKRALTKSWPQT